MLRPAQLYEQQLRDKILSSWYDLDNIFYSGYEGNYIEELPKSNYGSHNFVSVDKDDNIIGYIKYYVNWDVMSADQFDIISFDKGNVRFIRDLFTAVCDVFEKYHMNRIEFWCYADNPAIRGYRKFINRCGGREVGYVKQRTKLQDGKLHDSVIFEIMSNEFSNHKVKSDYSELTPEEIREMKRCIGFDYNEVYKAWCLSGERYHVVRKNRFYSSHCHNVWNVLEKKGFAEYIYGYFCVTKYGFDVLGKALGVTMYLEDE